MDTVSEISFGSSIRVNLPRVPVSPSISFHTASSGGFGNSQAASSQSGESTTQRSVTASGRSEAAADSSVAGGTRLRRRGRFTRAVERAVVASTWWSDLGRCGDVSPARAWMDSYFSGTSAKVVNVKDLVLKEGTEEQRVLQLVQVPFENGARASRALWVSPELVARLVAVRMFRPPGAALLASLRSRARLWAEEVGMDVLDLVRVMPGSVVMATLPSPDEVAAVGALRGAAGRWGVNVLGPLASGRLVSNPPRRFADYLQGPLGWMLGKSDERLLAAGVPQLNMQT